MKEGNYEEAAKTLKFGQIIPDHLGSGIWNRCKYVPYQYKYALCCEKLGNVEEAHNIYRMFLNIQVETFSNMHLPELPYYQALAADRLGMHNRAQNLMTVYKRKWTAQLDKVDNGYFNTTPFFISFIDNAADMRRAYYLYLTGLVDLYDNKTAQGISKLSESFKLNSDNLFAGNFSGNIQ